MGNTQIHFGFDQKIDTPLMYNDVQDYTVHGLTPLLRQFVGIRTTVCQFTTGVARGDCIIPPRKGSLHSLLKLHKSGGLSQLILEIWIHSVYLEQSAPSALKNDRYLASLSVRTCMHVFYCGLAFVVPE